MCGRRLIWDAMVCMALVMMLASCGQKYRVSGVTEIKELDGRVMYLKAYADEDLVTVDSASVIHGRFEFKGTIDSVMMVNLFMGDQSIMPLVLEPGEVKLDIASGRCRLSGTPMNDSLSAFIEKKNSIDARMMELPRLESRMIMDGMDEVQIYTELNGMAEALSLENDRLLTSFIKKNYNNVLGSGVFLIMTSSYEYPVMTPQIEEIMLDAPESFKADAYVRDYLRMAAENMKK